MATISGLTEGFEGGVAGSSLSSGSTIFNTITGTGNAATFVNTSYKGTLAMNMVASGGDVKTYRSDFTSQTSAWFAFALRIDVLPTATATIYQTYQNTTLAFAVRIDTSGAVQLRDGTTTRFTSSALTVGSWYWVSVKFTPGNATGARMKIYDATATLTYDSSNGAATATTATAMDNLRIGYLAGGGNITFSMDQLAADTTTEVAPEAASGGSSEITALHEDFENGAEGDALTTTSTIFTNITGAGPDATFVDNSYSGDLAMRVSTTGGALKTYRADYGSQTSAWFGFALRFDANPTAVATVFQMYQSSTVAFAIRLATDGTIQFRDGTVTRFTSSALTTNEWYWISAHFAPGSGSGSRLKVYNRAATLVYDSNNGAATSTTATSMDNLRVGYLAGSGNATYSIDRLRADTANEIEPIAVGSSTVNVEVAASPAMPEADDTVTLTATASGATAPYSYSWSQVSGASVTLNGTGNTRTFTAPALIESETLTFRCTVTPTAGEAASDTSEVPVLPHNFWTMHDGVLVPRRLYTRDGGSLVP